MCKNWMAYNSEQMQSGFPSGDIYLLPVVTPGATKKGRNLACGMTNI